MKIECIGGIIHLCGMILESTYGFLFSKNVLLDKLYMSTFALIPFSWIVFKDECIVSYIIKKYENPNYILGNEPNDARDITDLFSSKRIYNIFYHMNHFSRLVSLYIVNQRATCLTMDIIAPTFILYTLYVYDIHFGTPFRRIFFPQFQIALCVYLFSMSYNSIKEPYLRTCPSSLL
jgi:hypothetical protein